MGLLIFVESVEMAADVEAPPCDEVCRVLVALSSEAADWECPEEWVKEGVDTARRVRGLTHSSASPVASVPYKVSI